MANELGHSGGGGSMTRAGLGGVEETGPEGRGI